jgi:ribonucleoside-triphosphate reductase
MNLPTQYQQFIQQSRYARWIESEGRRETWEETVTRYCDFFRAKYGDVFPYERVKHAILNLHVMPSMRALMTAGPALARDNMAGFNCSYTPVDDVRAFDEILYVLMCGTGVGFSVENHEVSKLPVVPENLYATDTTIIVADSKIGWAKAFKELLAMLYSGAIPLWDVSRVRPAGAKLKVFGGRASGPAPLVDLFEFTVRLFNGARGRKLSALECHDLVCKVADVVVVGGVRRSALISLSDLSDQSMREAKSGQWWDDPDNGIVRHGQRQLANNSAVYVSKPLPETFLREWLALIESNSGERGIFSRVGAEHKAMENGRRKTVHQRFGTNPCGEIILRPQGLCNLTEVIVREDDTLQSLMEKVELATIIGTFQSDLTDFRYVRASWKRNAEEERLLGVSMTGIMDHEVLGSMRDELPYWLKDLKAHAIETNKGWAEKLGINQSVAITTVKPSGTVSQLVDSASGIHPRYSRYYIRTVRADKKDPLAQFMREKGFPVEDCKQKPSSVDIFSFPMKAPERSVYRTRLTAIQQLEHYRLFRKHWCEHNPSITVYVRPSEWVEVGNWVYNNFFEIGGVSFLPHTDHVYEQAPYQEISQEKFEELTKAMPVIDWLELGQFEKEDTTKGTQELACVSGVCEI